MRFGRARAWLPVVALVVALVAAGVVALWPDGGGGRVATSDVELRGRVNERLLRQPVGRPFDLSAIVPGDWDALWLLGGYFTPSDIEEVVGASWDGAPDEIAEGDVAVVIAARGGAVTGFIWNAPSRTYLDCLTHTRDVSFRPADRLVRLGPVPGEGKGSSVLSRAGARAQRICRQEALAPARTPGH